MRAIITMFDAKSVTLTLAAAGPVEEAARDRLHQLFRSSAVIEVHVRPAGQAGAARVTLVAGATPRRTEETAPADLSGPQRRFPT